MPRTPLQQWTLSLPRVTKRGIAVLLDSVLCVVTVWLALCLRLESWVTLEGRYWWPVGASVLLAIPLFVRHGLYRAVFRYAGWNAMRAVIQAMALYALGFGLVFTVIGLRDVPRSIGIIQPMLLLLAAGGLRTLGRYWLGGLYRQALRQAKGPHVLIYGAGRAGQQLAAALGNDSAQQLLGFLDDDERLHGQSLDGRPVYSPAQLATLVPKLGLTDVLLAMPSASRQRRIQILEQLRQYPLRVRTLPGVADLVSGRVTFSDIRELDIEDLLGRPPVTPDDDLLRRHITGKVVLVTGAGGSIGSELCRQILRAGPSHLLLTELSEYALYQICDELEQAQASVDPARRVTLVPLLASAQDPARMSTIMATWRPHTVYHAAAYKHVPLVEHNPVEGVQNNVWGTWTCADAAARHGVRNFVLISTDKAVRPTNTMGASKRLAEMVLQAMAATHPDTCFCMVRFGNVLGSSGSVVPLFRRQIHAGGPVTVTHPDITRYFMTIEEASQLVIQAAALARGGDVFVLDMGEPVRILDLARRMVELSGLKVRDEQHADGDIELRFTGLRPGEKLFEELLIGNNPQPTAHPRIMKAHEDHMPWASLAPQLALLQGHLTDHDVVAVRAMLERLVPDFHPSSGIVDWVHVATPA
ncbi:nucleoside-diphosphate sugar epimerase/dehydratase [Hydrogenophaga sp. OTU3427]|uniref:nucleoside-diphosphate sugar epimerase/dehydratase n=1 Tax=Hydrogenophaga sp. OTU3427 TaxID=3043856 RepID=UPI00313BEB4E